MTVTCETCGKGWEFHSVPVGVALPLCMHCAKGSLAGNDEPPPEPDAAA